MSKSFKQATQLDSASALVVDTLNLAFRWKHKKALQFAEEYLATVHSLAKSYKCSKIIFAADHGASSYRLAILPTYKSGRAEARKDQSEADAEYFEKFLEEYRRLLAMIEKNDKYVLFRSRGVEADDWAAAIVKRKEYFGIDKIWLISSDKDWDLLISDGVSRFSYVTTKETTLENWHEHYDITPEEYISYKCLIGDTGDTIPGVAKIGPVRAKELIKKYGSAFDIYDSLPIPGKLVYINNLNASGDLILTNYRLMDLVSYCDEAIGEENLRFMEIKLKDYLSNEY